MHDQIAIYIIILHNYISMRACTIYVHVHFNISLDLHRDVQQSQ